MMVIMPIDLGEMDAGARWPYSCDAAANLGGRISRR